MRVAVNSHALPIYKKNRIASLLCIFETTIKQSFLGGLLSDIVVTVVCRDPVYSCSTAYAELGNVYSL